MIRLVCPYCHSPLGADELETASVDGHACLVCPECSGILVTEAAPADDQRPVQRQAAGDA